MSRLRHGRPGEEIGRTVERTQRLSAIWKPLLGSAALAAGFGLGAGSSTADSHVRDRSKPHLPAPPKDGVMGFVVSHFAPAIYNDRGNCPNGAAGTLRENYLATLPVEERARLLAKENEPELDKRWKSYATGANGTNICSNPDMFDRPPQNLLEGQVARGLDLDAGISKDNGCAHEEFTSPEGQTGIDNQAWRAMGCWPTWRGPDGNGGEVVSNSAQRLISGEDGQVLIIRGVDSLVEDDEVEIVYANTQDRAVVDSRRTFLPNASYSVSPMPRYRNALRGRIRDGVLTSEPSDIVLKQTWGQGGARDIRGSRTAYALKRARLQLEFQPDGSLKGLVGGYQPLWNVIAAQSIGGLGSAVTGGIDCAAQYQALQLMADGDRDPRTGVCGTISSAFQAVAVPAFVNDRVPTLGPR